MRDLTSISLFLHDVKVQSARKGSLIVALDGRSASGKSTLARQLQLDYGWSVVHLDHFYLRPEQRTEERYQSPGENVDHERFLSEVLLPLRAGRSVEYRPYDCNTGSFGEPVRVEASSVVLVEGSYACHPKLWDCYDLRVFMTAAPEVQLRRILAREGPEKAEVFQNKWIPLEEAYFSAMDVEARCDYRLES